MDALSGMGGLGFNSPLAGLGGLPMAMPMATPLATPGLALPGMLGDGFSASPELAGETAHPWLSGGAGGLGGGGLGLDLASLGAGLLDPGMAPPDLGSGLGGGSLANQAAALQAGMGDANLANAALVGADAIGAKNGAFQNQILGDAAALGLG